MDFYRQIKSFSNFAGINDPRNFSRVPPDWVVVVTDVKGSTKAVQEGRFKDVNMLGASAITLLTNQLRTTNTASVFGGDGATLLMPFTVFAELRPQLVGLIKLARERFALELRVGAVKVSDLDHLGCPIFVGKYQVSPHTALAQLMGAGCSKAETLVKTGAAPAIGLTENEPSQPPDLDGLSCRLDSIESRHGQILSIIVRPRQEGESEWVRKVLLQQISAVFGGDWALVNPVSRPQLKWRLLPQTLASEILLRRQKPFDTLRLVLKAVVANVMLKCGISAGGFVVERYKSEVPAQSDFKKFDDNLRIVIDCSDEQSRTIVDLLQTAMNEGHIFYGVHSSRKAVVTCVTFSAGAGDHVHFVDGDGCGYTQASVHLKTNLEEQRTEQVKS